MYSDYKDLWSKVQYRCSIQAFVKTQKKSINLLKFSQQYWGTIFCKSDNILLGDLNINLLEHQTHQETGNYLAVIQSLNYILIISRPTRFPVGNQRGNESLLDHIYVNFTLPSISGITIRYIGSSASNTKAW